MNSLALRRRRWIAVFALLTLVQSYVAVVLPAASQAPHAAAEAGTFVYEFNYANGETWTGSIGSPPNAQLATDGSLSDPGLFATIGNFDNRFAHVSCSENFTDGWHDGGGTSFPQPSDGEQWRIVSYTITTGASQTDTCGETFVEIVDVSVSGACAWDPQTDVTTYTYTVTADAGVTVDFDGGDQDLTNGQTYQSSSGSASWTATAPSGSVFSNNSATTSGTATVADCTPEFAQLGDYVWFDLDRDGTQDASEPGVSGVSVVLYDASDDSMVDVEVTDGSGEYLFTGLEPGTYYAVFGPTPPGFTGYTTQNAGGDDTIDSDADPVTRRTADVTLAAGESNLTVDAGLLAVPQCPLELTEGSILIDGLDQTPRFRDGNDQSLLSEGSLRFGFNWVTGVTVPAGAYDLTLVAFDSHLADGDGGNQPTERYYLTAWGSEPGTNGTSSATWTDPVFIGGPSDDVPEDGDYSPPVTFEVEVTEDLTHFSTIHYTVVNGPVDDIGSVIPTCVRFDPKELSELGDFVWFDEDGDGVQDAEEPGIEGVTVNLWSSVDDAPGAVLATTSTDADGLYLFEGLDAGEYFVQFELPDGWDGFTTQDAGSDDAIDSDADPATGITSEIALDWGDSNLTIDAGLVVAPQALGSVCELTDIEGELVSLITIDFEGVPNTTIEILDGVAVVASTTLDASGEGSLQVEAGTYSWQALFAGEVILSVDEVTFEDCPPEIADEFGFCVNDGPYLEYDIDAVLADGTVATSIDLFFFAEGYAFSGGEPTDDDLANAVTWYEDVPFEGIVVWPGAAAQASGGAVYDGRLAAPVSAGDVVVTGITSDLTAIAWPGWVENPDGSFDGPDAGPFASLVNGQLVARVNPLSGSVQLVYPPRTENCFPLASIGDFVWEDLDEDGIQDPGESGVADVTVELLADGVVNAITTTDVDGFYEFTDLPSFNADDEEIVYQVRFALPVGYEGFTERFAGDPAEDSNVDSAGLTEEFVVAPGTKDLTFDAGLIPFTEVEGIPDLAISKTDNGTEVVLTADEPNGEIPYVLTIENVSEILATGVVVTDTLPDTVTFKSAVPSKGTCSVSGQVVTCQVGDMAAGETMTIDLTVATESFGELTVAEVVNVAVVDANEDELTDDNNRAEETTPISEVRDELPETGYDSGRLALIGVLALGLGGLLLGVTRRRGEGETA